MPALTDIIKRGKSHSQKGELQRQVEVPGWWFFPALQLTVSLTFRADVGVKHLSLSRPSVLWPCDLGAPGAGKGGLSLQLSWSNGLLQFTAETFLKGSVPLPTSYGLLPVNTHRRLHV